MLVKSDGQKFIPFGFHLLHLPLSVMTRKIILFSVVCRAGHVKRINTLSILGDALSHLSLILMASEQLH